MDRTLRSKAVTILICLVVTFMVCVLAVCAIAINTQTVSAATNGEIDYSFDKVPAEEVVLSAGGNISEIQPRQSFSLSFTLTPWYTTTTRVFYDVFPESAASVSTDGVVTVSNNAVVGSTFTVTAGADDSLNVTSEPLTFEIAKIPVVGLTLERDGNDDRIHLGKTRQVTPNFNPAYATHQDVRYELTGSAVDLGYIAGFDNKTGIITAKDNIVALNANATVTVTAYALDDESFSASQTFTIYLPTVIVELTASTPLGVKNAEDNPLAVSSSTTADTVQLNTNINGVGIGATGLNYVIMSGKEYVKNGSIKPDGSFELKAGISEPNAEVKVRVAYSDGYDDLTVSVYVPVETISFVNIAPTSVENFRSYNLQAVAAPSYATYLYDNAAPLTYTLNGLSSEIATVDGNGLVTLPKSLTSWGTMINFSAYMPGAWFGVDAAPLTHNMNIVPVYATSFETVTILKNEVAINPTSNKVLPDDMLNVEVSYTVDNVTHLGFTLSENSNMLSVAANNVNIGELSSMTEDNPQIEIVISYNEGGQSFSVSRSVVIYVPAKSATLTDKILNRGENLDLNDGLLINGHNFTSNHTITWGTPIVTAVNGQTDVTATVTNGGLFVASKAHAGTTVTVPYKTVDGEWQDKTYTVAPLDGQFTLSYGNDGNYTIDASNPQLETGHSIDLILKYNGAGAANRFGVSYTVAGVSINADLTVGAQINEDDRFTLQAKTGQSGRDNRISYEITVVDGTSSYTVKTNGTSSATTHEIEIFNRIDGSIDVTNSTVVYDSTFAISNWDAFATFNESDLTWNITNFGNLTNRAMPAGVYSGFTLTVSATQKYNGHDISWSKSVGFNMIYYADGSGARIYKKQGATDTLRGAYATASGKRHSGWSTSEGGVKAYSFGQSYNASGDLTLYPYWTTTATSLTWSTETYADEDQGHFHTGEQGAYFNYNELWNLGYRNIKITGTLKTRIFRDKPKYEQSIWLDINQTRVWGDDSFDITSQTASYYTLSFYVSLATCANDFKVRFGVECIGEHGANNDSWWLLPGTITFTAT